MSREKRLEIVDLGTRIKQCSREKAKLESYLQDLKEDLLNNELDRVHYDDLVGTKVNGKTIPEWLSYYDDYIGKCQERIDRLRYESNRSSIMRVGFSLGGLFFIFALLLGTLLYLTTEQQPLLAPSVEYIDDVGESFTESGEYIWNLKNLGILQSLKTSGSIEGDGSVIIYLNDLLILDSDTLPISDIEGILLAPLGNESNGTEINDTIETQPDPLVPPPENETEQNDTNISIPPLPPDNESENNDTNVSEPPPPTEPPIKKFSNYCDQTCDLSQLEGFDLEEYDIKIVIGGEATLNLGNITYEILGEEIEEEIERVEEKIKKGKRVRVSKIGNKKHVTITSEVPESWKIREKSNLEIRWNEKDISVEFEVYDTDDNGILDLAKWQVPDSDTGEETFEIIVITNAEHLDQNREFISDIFREVRELDDVWSETIPTTHYVRVTFELLLDSSKDITIYPRIISGNPRIEVFEIDGTEIIAEFTDLIDNEYNTVFLTSLVGEQDTFDLRIVGGSLEFDHIIDPAFGQTRTTLSFQFNDYGLGARFVDNSDFEEIPIELNDYSDNNEKCSLWDCSAWSQSINNHRGVYCSGGWNCVSFNGNSCDQWQCILWTEHNIDVQINYCSGGWTCLSATGDVCDSWVCSGWSAAATYSDEFCDGVWDCTTWNGNVCEQLDCTLWTPGASVYNDYYCGGGWDCVNYDTNGMCDQWDCLGWTNPPQFRRDQYCSGTWDCIEWNGDICDQWKCSVWTSGQIQEFDYYCSGGWSCALWDLTRNACEQWDCLTWSQAPQNRRDQYCSGTWDCTSYQTFNVAPTIVPGSITVTPNPVTLEAGTTTDITVEFTAEDLNNPGDLVDSSAIASFTKIGETQRDSISCSGVLSGIQVTYTCTVTMQYYDGPGTWDVTVSVEDQAMESAVETNIFDVSLLQDITLSGTPIDFGVVSPSVQINAPAFTVTNNGNYEGTIKITAQDLAGPETLFATSFFAAESNVIDICTNGNQLQDSTLVEILSTNLLKDTFPGEGMSEDIIVCLNVPPSIQPGDYTATGPNAWEITLSLAAFIRKRKKNKKDLKNDNLLKAISLMTDELKVKYDMNRSDLIKALGLEKNNSIPMNIFSRKLGGLEALCKFMKENLEMSYHEIAKEISRDDRTVWTAVKKAKEKSREKIRIEKDSLMIPLEIFKDRKLTVLEAVIIHLREKGMKYSEIGKMLERDQRNVQKIYSRANKK